MIAARSWRTDITNILLEGEHIDLDIQENVSQAIIHFNSWSVQYALSHQTTGWSALHFSVNRGDPETAEILLKAGANAHLKDKVCTHYIRYPYHLPFPSLLVKNGLTVLKITEVKAANRLIGRRSDYKTVISLLREHIGETLSIHNVSLIMVYSSRGNVHMQVADVESDEEITATHQDTTYNTSPHQRRGASSITQV